MGVTGLWRLIEPSGKPVPLETLENKVLAVDVSIWLHQALKGFHDSQGATLPNAHLLGVYHRVCKLLYFKIKPIFVFDGGVPTLKKETIAKRSQQKNKKLSEAERIQKQLLTTLLKHSAVNQVLSEKAKSDLIKQANLNLKDNENTTECIYKLPSTNLDTTTSTDDESTSETSNSSPSKQWDLHTIDEQSVHFKTLPVDIRHEILTELKETRKQNSWGRLHELPKQSGDFASYQMKRLLKRYSVQVSLEEVQKEMGGCSMSLAELETLLKDQGVVLSNDSVGSRIASDETTKYLLIKDVRKAMDEAKKQEELAEKKIKNEEAAEQNSKISNENVVVAESETKSEYEKDLEMAVQLSLQEVPSTSKDNLSFLSKSQASYLDNFKDGDFRGSSESEEEIYDFTTARNYMVEYSGLSANEINKIIDENATKANKTSISLKKKLICKEKEPLEAKAVEDTKNEAQMLDSESISKNPIAPILEVEKPEVISAADTQQDVVEIMSDSEDSDDLMEVSESTEKPLESTQLEILIKPDETLEDDLFSDIFSAKTETTPNNVKEPLKEVQVIDSIRSLKNKDSNVNDKPLAVTDMVFTEKEAVSEEKINETNNIQNSILLQPDENSSLSEKTISLIEVTQVDTSIAKESNVIVETPKQVLTTEQLQDIRTDLDKEKNTLVAEMNAKTRMANNLSDQIHQEAQELLQLFGVPYIVAPMEAEAQCAFLEYMGFTSGTITDDSDIWLFGGKTVYKNFFDQRKLVMEYRSENIQHHFKLTRDQMILLALLVGSDYTTGLQGIGPVTALEILAAFPLQKKSETELSNDIISGLKEFRRWLEGHNHKGPKRVALRSKLRNISLIDSFPSSQVVKAYLEPSVDTSKEPFSWSKPDIPGLIEFARTKFGWPHLKSEKILEPVLKRLGEVRMQKSIKDYFGTKLKIDAEGAKNKMSKRVKSAVERIGQGDELSEDETKPSKQVRKKGTSKTTKKDTEKVSVGQNVKEAVEKPKTKKRPIKTRTTSDVSSSIAKASAGLSSDEDVQVLKSVCVQSKEKMKRFKSEIKNDLEQVSKKPRTTASFHKKDVVPQIETDKLHALRSKMKAIEVFRRSKKGPGYVGKGKTATRKPKADAELSESSSSD